MSRESASPTRSRLRLFLPLGIIAVVLVAGFFAARGMMRTVQAESEVRRDIIALATEGGYVGPFHIHCERYDLETGEFVHFIAETDELIVTARRARVLIDPKHDTISFDLYAAVVMRVPGAGGPQPAQMESIQHHELGPLPYGVDIIEK